MLLDFFIAHWVQKSRSSPTFVGRVQTHASHFFRDGRRQTDMRRLPGFEPLNFRKQGRWDHQFAPLRAQSYSITK